MTEHAKRKNAAILHGEAVQRTSSSKAGRHIWCRPALHCPSCYEVLQDQECLITRPSPAPQSDLTPVQSQKSRLRAPSDSWPHPSFLLLVLPQALRGPEPLRRPVLLMLEPEVAQQVSIAPHFRVLLRFFFCRLHKTKFKYLRRQISAAKRTGLRCAAGYGPRNFFLTSRS